MLINERRTLRIRRMFLSLHTQLWMILFWATTAAESSGLSSRKCCSDNSIPSSHECKDGLAMDIKCGNSTHYLALRELYSYKIKDGVLIVNYNEYEQIILPDEYCTGVKAERNGNLSNVVITCFSSLIDHDPNMESKLFYLKIYSYLILVSVVFLIATFIVYCATPRLRDLQGKCLMSFVGCLSIGYFSLAVLQQNFFDYNVSNMFCTVFGFWTYFWLLSAFFWLSIMSFNIWFQSRFAAGTINCDLWIIYLILGFGIPVFYEAAAIVSHHIPDILLKPNIGDGVCWFQGPVETWVYFTGPMAVLLFCNSIFFIMTTRILWIHYKEARPQQRIRTLRFKMVLCLKLFLIMGLAWIFELISYIFEIDWYVSDLFNSLQGPTIFILMVISRRKLIRNFSVTKCSLCYNTRQESQQTDDDEIETEAIEDFQLN